MLYVRIHSTLQWHLCSAVWVLSGALVIPGTHSSSWTDRGERQPNQKQNQHLKQEDQGWKYGFPRSFRYWKTLLSQSLVNFFSVISHLTVENTPQTSIRLAWNSISKMSIKTSLHKMTLSIVKSLMAGHFPGEKLAIIHYKHSTHISLYAIPSSRPTA